MDQEFNKKKLGSKSRKKEFNSKSLDNNNAYSNLNNSNAYIFAKKKLGHLYIYLNKKNQSPIKQEEILFNTGAETYITKSINNFNISIYILVTLLLINIVNRQAKPLSFNKRIIIYTINTKGEIYILNLNKI